MAMQRSFEELRTESNGQFIRVREQIVNMTEGQRILRQDMEAGFERLERKFDFLTEDHVVLKEQVSGHESRIRSLESG